MQGEIVFTTIKKKGMPLIRYRTKDITKLFRDHCECGRTLVKMERVTGRNRRHANNQRCKCVFLHK
jgi:phenylacetate-CoA ligase